MTAICFPAEKLFSPSVYKPQNSKDKKIAEFALGNLKSLKGIGDLNYRESTYGLSLLSVAVMTRKHYWIRFLLNHKACPRSIDKGGLNPVVYASIIDDLKALKLFKEKIDSVSLEVFKNFPSWQSYLEPNFYKNNETVIEYMDPERGLIPLSAKDFRQKAGALYYNGIYARKKDLIDLFVRRLQMKPLTYSQVLNRVIRKKYKNFKRDDFSRFYLAQDSDSSLGVFAKMPLKAWEICAECSGKLDLSERKGRANDYYLTETGVDSSQLRNVGSMIKDSFANVGFFNLFLPDGTVQTVVIPYRNIQKGEGIYASFCGNFMMKTNLELNAKEMENFFRKHSIDDLLSKMLCSLDKLETHMFFGHLAYLILNPEAIIYLFLKGILTKGDIDKITSNPCLIHEVKGHNSHFFNSAIEMIKKLDETRLKSGERFEKFTLSLLDLVQKNPLYSVIDAVSILCEFPFQDWKEDYFVLTAQGIEQTMVLIDPTFSMAQKEKALSQIYELTRQLPYKLSFMVFHIMTKNVMEKKPNIPKLNETIEKIQNDLSKIEIMG